MSEEIDESNEEDEGEMPWEWEAREAVENAASTIEKDEVRGVIYMEAEKDHEDRRVRREFKSWEDVMQTLTELGESEWVGYAPYEGGEPVFEPSVDGYVESAMAEYEVEQFFDTVKPPEEEELISAHDLLEDRAGLVVQADLQVINDELVRYLAKHPEMMHELNWRKFEELVAELFRDKGYDVELGRGTKDGGSDIRAFLRSDIGALLTLIQCKHYAAHRKIDVDAVRGLYGVVTLDNASAGMIVTTSTFTRDARSEQSKIKHRMHLADFKNLTDWLKEYPRRRRLN